MADLTPTQGESLPPTTKTRYTDEGDGTHALTVHAYVEAPPAGGDPIQVESAPSQGSLTDRSGSIAVLDVSQQVMAANTDRKYLFFYNVSAVTMWINFGVAAVKDQPSIEVPSGSSYVQEAGFVSTQALNVICGTATSKYVSKEG